MAGRSRLLAMAMAGVVLACDGQKPAASPTQTPGRPSSSPVDTPRPTVAPLPRPEWSPILSPSGASGRTWLEPALLTRTGTSGWVTDVAAGPDGWVAVGSSVTSEDLGKGLLAFQSRSGLIWTSADGSGWTSMQTPAFAKAQLFGIAWTSQGFIAVGNWKDERRNPKDPADPLIVSVEPAAWRSPDGVTWTRLSVRAASDEGIDGGRLNAVAEAGGRLVAVGCLDDACSIGPAMWLADAAGVLQPVTGPTARDSAYVDAVIATPAGLVATGGYNSVEGGPYRAAAWTSDDGTRWEPAESIDANSYSMIRDVTLSESTLLAVGSVSDDVSQGVDSLPGIWRSADAGRTWQLAPEAGLGIRRATWLDAVLWTGRSFIALGRLDDAQPWRPTAWVSTDGIGWEAIEMAGIGAAPSAVADGPVGVVAVGGGYGPWVGEYPPPVLPDIMSWRSPVADR